MLKANSITEDVPPHRRQGCFGYFIEYHDEAHYVGCRIGEQEIGLDPNGHNKGMTGPVGYWHVNDIKKSLQLLPDAGARAQQEVKDVGGGTLIASVNDADGNIIGLIQSP